MSKRKFILADTTTAPHDTMWVFSQEQIAHELILIANNQLLAVDRFKRLPYL